MCLLANGNLSAKALDFLRSRGHDIAWVRADAPGSTDRQLFDRAVAEDRVLITFDKHFGELAFRGGLPASSGVVLFRIRLTSPSQVAQRATAVLESRSDWAGHFAVVLDDRVRMTLLPSNGHQNP
jgi:predicted nuclease of predicted toxin-antitoxin system